MSKRMLLTFAAALLLVGAGCSAENTANPNQNGDQAEAMEKPAMIKSDPTVAKKSIELSAEALGSGEVAFIWKIGDGVTETDKFRIVRSTEENPEFDGKNYWLQVDKSRDEITWVALPRGTTQHFRLCTFDGDSCKEYSNDVAVEVQ